MTFKAEKSLVREFLDAFESSTVENVADKLKAFISSDYKFKGYYPYGHEDGFDFEKSCEMFWHPILHAVKSLQRREDMFIAGFNRIKPEDKSVWVMSMGHYMGLFDQELLGLRPTGKMISIRYTEFHCVDNKKIIKTGMFIDVIGIMESAGAYPLPPSTGKYFMYPGPKTNDGVLTEDRPASEGDETYDLVNRMVSDLTEHDVSGSMTFAPEVLAKTWSKDMCWYGPCGIGASMTIPRYQMQHQLPFRGSLTNKACTTKDVFIAEGNFGALFGWNLTHTPIGGFMGLPGGQVKCLMQCVDVYARRGGKLTENWVTLDLVHWLKDQGLDVIQRTNEILNPNWLS